MNYEKLKCIVVLQSKHKVVSMKCYDINGDGIIELLTGWSSGKVDARLCGTGEIVFRIQLPIAIAALVEADYRKTGKPDLIVVSVTGEGEKFFCTLIVTQKK